MSRVLIAKVNSVCEQAMTLPGQRSGYFKDDDANTAEDPVPAQGVPADIPDLHQDRAGGAGGALRGQGALLAAGGHRRTRPPALRARSAAGPDPQDHP